MRLLQPHTHTHTQAHQHTHRHTQAPCLVMTLQMCSNVSFGIIVYLLTVCLQGSSCNQCILHMQDHCKNENEALIKAEQEHKLAELCSSLYDIFKCVAFREFECLEIAMQTLDHHTHSPHGCPLGQEIVIELQQIGQNASANKMATSTGQPETSTIETSPTTVAIVTNITDSVQSGSKEEHTGSKTHNSASSGKMAGLQIHILTVLGLTLTLFLQRNILS